MKSLLVVAVLALSGAGALPVEANQGGGTSHSALHAVVGKVWATAYTGIEPLRADLPGILKALKSYGAGSDITINVTTPNGSAWMKVAYVGNARQATLKVAAWSENFPFDKAPLLDVVARANK